MKHKLHATEIRWTVFGLKNQRRHNKRHCKDLANGCPFAVPEIHGCRPCRYLFPSVTNGCPCDELAVNYIIRKSRRFVKENRDHEGIS